MGSPMLWHLGAEYDCIATALRSGRGFADPFYVQSGPTAWMPPVMPCILASFYWLCGDDRNGVIVLFTCLQGLSISLTIAMVLSEAQRIGRYWFGIVIVAIGISVNYDSLFQITHDHGILLGVVAAIYFLLVKAQHQATRSTAVVQGFCGGFAALCSPICGLVWASGLSMFQWKRLRWVMIAGATSVLVISPWMIRNRLALGRWVPIKSAGKFEVYFSMVVDDDGIVDMNSFQQHPWLVDNDTRALYAKLGESAFIDHFDPQIREKVMQEPMDCVSRIANRFLSATILWQPLLVDQHSEWFIVIRSVVFAFPFYGLLVVLFKSKDRRCMRESVAAHIYIAGLLPYIAITYYERHGIPLIGIKMLLVLYGFETFLGSRSEPVDRDGGGQEAVGLESQQLLNQVDGFRIDNST
ncbi:hypothetical protein [Rhodopirellula europaea]|uniref:hypothetical protein n=1 Tax=Rhodopirellula europaea TaxID=1263866 RepID=UPI003D285ECC|tara:strand:+ start:322 stop:1554 length:1233 start_codon:yes stop_codon:yes gene_type:complete